MGKHPDMGDPAPDFELEGTDGSFRLSDHRGERVVLLFYPGDNTRFALSSSAPTATTPRRSALEATVVGISSQSVHSHQGFSEKHGLNVPLLADEGGAVAKEYGAHTPIVGTKRAVIVIDEDGIVRHRHDHRLGLDFESVDDLRDALATLATRA